VGQGVVKSYDPVTGVGVVVREPDMAEIYLRPGSLSGSVFRTLRQGQRIIFDAVDEEDGAYVVAARMGQDGY